ncbi:MAG: hypothetical protein ABI852_16520 [Gemmatimonadaceae bacterium]
MSKEPIDAPANDARLHVEGGRPSSPADVGTGRIDDPDSKGDESSKQELTGRAAGTGEDLMSLFANGSDEHLRDGFHSGNGDDPESDVERTDEFPQIDR